MKVGGSCKILLRKWKAVVDIMQWIWPSLLLWWGEQVLSPNCNVEDSYKQCKTMLKWKKRNRSCCQKRGKTMWPAMVMMLLPLGVYISGLFWICWIICKWKYSCSCCAWKTLYLNQDMDLNQYYVHLNVIEHVQGNWMQRCKCSKVQLGA